MQNTVKIIKFNESGDAERNVKEPTMQRLFFI